MLCGRSQMLMGQKPKELAVVLQQTRLEVFTKHARRLLRCQCDCMHAESCAEMLRSGPWHYWQLTMHHYDVQEDAISFTP